MRTTLRRGLAAVSLAVIAFSAHADIFLVVNAANPVRSMTQKQALDLYMGRTRNFPNGDYALPFDQARDAAGRQSFYRLLTGMDLAQINSSWARLMFTGQTMPPQPLPNDATVIEVVKRNPGAIGYLGKAPTDASLAVVLVLKDAGSGAD
jgi:ABC-type phosphate transport system substrate-binding protein